MECSLKCSGEWVQEHITWGVMRPWEGALVGVSEKHCKAQDFGVGWRVRLCRKRADQS